MFNCKNHLILFLYFLLHEGMTLGSGAFGLVVKAEAIGLNENEPVSTVAVKSVISQALGNTEPLVALVSEMKIMQFLGSHLNVLKLLGACTKDISKGK